MTHVEENYQTDNALESREENESFRCIHRPENDNLESQRDRHFDDKEKKSFRCMNISDKQFEMDVLNVKEFSDDREISQNSSTANRDSLVSNSGKVFDAMLSDENSSGKQQHGGKHHRTQSDKYGDDYSYSGRKFHDRSDSHKSRRRSRSVEARHSRRRSREGSTRQKQRRSHSRSVEKSPRYLQECDSDHGEKTRASWENERSNKTEPLRSKNEIADSVLNGDQTESDNQLSSDRKYDVRDTGGHSRFKEDSGSKERSRARSPCSEVESLRTRSPSTRPNYDDRDGDRLQNKRHKLSSPEPSEDALLKDRESRSDHRYRRRRSRSRSGSHSKYHRHHRSSHQRRRSRSRSRDNSRSRRWERSDSQAKETESKFGTSDRRPRSRTRSRECGTIEDGRTNKSEDGLKRMYEEDEGRRNYSLSKSESRHQYRSYDARDVEYKHTREPVKDFSNAEAHSSDGASLKRRRSRSTERNWSGYSDRTFRQKFTSSRGYRWNSGSRGGGDKDGRPFSESYKGNFRQSQWRSDVEDSGDDGRDRKVLGQGRRQDWHDSRQQHEGQEQETHCNDGKQLEDMVVKSLAKLRQDSDKEHQAVVDGSDVVTSDQENNSIPRQNRREDDHSTIPVLLSKKSVYASNDKANNYDKALEPENNNCISETAESFANESSMKRHLLPSRDRPSRHPRPGHSRFQGDFQQLTPPPPPRFEFQGRGRPRMPPPRGLIPGPPLGVRLPPGFVQPGVIVAPFHLRPPAIQEVSQPVDWRVVGPMGAHPSPPVGPGRQLVQVGGFIRTQVPVEFLAGPPLPSAPTRFSHPPPFQPGMPPPPPHALPPVHPGVPMHPLPVRTGDPLHMQQPVALMPPRHIRMSGQEFQLGLVDVPSLTPLRAIVSSHPSPTTINIGIPPPPLPVRISGSGQALPGFGFPMSSQGIDPNAPNLSPTPPPPPPQTSSVGLLDPRLNPVKLFSQQHSRLAVQQSPGSTSDDSVKSDLSDEHHGGRATLQHADENPIMSGSPSQCFMTSERPPSALSVESGCSPQRVTDDAYTEALFEEPYHRPSQESGVQTLSRVPENSSMLSGASALAVSVSKRDGLEAAAVLNDVAYRLVNHDEEPPLIPEIVNPMESPNDEVQFVKRSSPSASANALNVSTHTFDMIQVSDLQKVLETVRTSVLSSEEELKSQDKLPNRMDQIAEEVKLALKPHFGKGLINKEEYKDIMRKTVPKIFSSKSTLDRARIQSFVQEYVNKIVKARKSEKTKKPSSQGLHPQKHNVKISSKTV